MHRWLPVSASPHGWAMCPPSPNVFGGLLILVGLFTRAAAVLVFIDLAVALWTVHLHNGLMGTPDRPGYEFALAAAALAFALIFFGAGPIAIDHVLRGGGRGASKRS